MLNDVPVSKRCYSSSLKLNRTLSLLTFLSLFAISIYAQVLYGSLTGTVLDPSGAAISGATVSAVEARTGVSQQARMRAVSTASPHSYRAPIRSQSPPPVSPPEKPRTWR
jgi:hypothetical protein